jgi:hypothetical protein
MRGLLLRDVREEIVSLLNESTEVHQSGDPQTAVSILVEAQFLLSDAIQNELKSIDYTPSLASPADEWSEE